MGFRSWLPLTLGLVLVAPVGCDEDSGTGDGTGADDGKGCTQIGCESSLTIALAHTFPTSGDPTQVTFEFSDRTIRCSVPAGGEGTESCFGFAFANITFDTSMLTLTLVSPFDSTPDNPEAAPYEDVTVVVTRSGVEVANFVLPIDAGEPDAPNGEGCSPVCWAATATSTIP